MKQRDRGSLTDSDAHDLLFGPGEHHLDDLPDLHDEPHYDPVLTRRRSRAEVRHHARRKRRGRVLALLAAVLVVVVLLAGYFIALPIYRYFNPADYSGSGTGTVVVTVHANDGAGDIGKTLKSAGVVESVEAFTDAASDDDRSQNIQPGSYRLRKHMSAASALGLLLDPSARLNSDVVVPEGVTTLDVAARLEAPPCTSSTAAGTVCGLGLSSAAVTKALADVQALGLPTDFTAGGVPKSAEGFLFPATYPFDSRTTVTDALQQMITRFTDEARTTNFSASAQALKLTPYRALIVASIAQAEAKFPADMAKVARVILNRLAAKMPLQIDATSAYGAKIAGQDPTKITFSTYPSVYNSYQHDGLPPTPISNPGAEAMTGAVHPAAGNWLYYVNSDAAGHLFFTNDAKAFDAAAAKCRAHKWGCG